MTGRRMRKPPCRFAGPPRRGFRVRLAALAALLTLLACSSGQSAAESDPAATQTPGAAVQTPAGTMAGSDTTGLPETGAGSAATGAVPADCEDLQDAILRVPPTRAALAAEYGAPDSVRSSTEPNRHVAGATDSLFTVHYPGFVADMRTPAGARDMATHVLVESSRYLAFPGIGIGATADRLREVLGEPDDAGSAYVRYQCSDAVEQPVTFRLTAGRVSAIEIHYYVD